jgi:hypothetical protein
MKLHTWRSGDDIGSPESISINQEIEIGRYDLVIHMHPIPASAATISSYCSATRCTSRMMLKWRLQHLSSPCKLVLFLRSA